MKTQAKNIVIWTEKLEISKSLKDISLNIEKGELIGITGLNKDEKKAFIRILACFSKPQKGKYIFDYEDISLVDSDRLEAIRTEKIGYVFDSPKLFNELNVMQNVTLWLDYIYSSKTSLQLGKNILTELSMEEKSLSSIEELNNLEKAIVSLSRAVINNPILLLIDNIFSCLKPEEEEEIIKILLKLTIKGITIIAFTDSIKVLSEVNRVIKY